MFELVLCVGFVLDLSEMIFKVEKPSQIVRSATFVSVLPGLSLNGALKSAMVEGPDNVLIELVEGHAKKE